MFEILGEATPEHFIKKTTYFPTTLPYGRSLLASYFLHLRTSIRSHNASTMNIPFLSKICQHICNKIIDKKQPRLLVIPTYFLMSYPGKKPTKKTSPFLSLLRYFKEIFHIIQWFFFFHPDPHLPLLPNLLCSKVSHAKDPVEKITHKP